MPEECAQSIQEHEYKQYARDGVVVLRRVLPSCWVQRMTTALAQLAHDISPIRGHRASPGSFIADTMLWLVLDDFRDFAWHSPAAQIAAVLLHSSHINFYHDQLFIKPRHCEIRTPWHQDITFWPLQGTQICTIWVPVDIVDLNSGGLEFVRRSHLWNKRFKAVRPDNLAYFINDELEDPPDVDARRGDYDVVSFSLEPGDVLVFDPRILHGAGPNLSNRPRRAFATRWVGDDVRYMPARATVRFPWHHGLQPGDRFSGPLFPTVWPTVDPTERVMRERGPIHKDPELVSQIRADYAAAEAKRKLNNNNNNNNN